MPSIVKDVNSYLSDAKKQQRLLSEYLISLNMEASEELLVNDLIEKLPQIYGPYVRYVYDDYENIVEAHMYNFQEIPDDFFTDISTLRKVTFTNCQIRKIGARAFKGCTSLEDIDLMQPPEEGSSTSTYPDGSELTLSWTNQPYLTILEDEAFRDCVNLKAPLPNTLSYIGDYALSKTAYTELTHLENLYHVGKQAFGECPNLTSFTWYGDWSHRYLGDYIFYNCPKLSQVNVPEGIETLPGHMFYRCPQIAHTSQDLPNTLVHIGPCAYACTSCNITSFPESLRLIGNGAFRNCPNITDVVVHENVGLSNCVWNNSYVDSIVFKCNMDSAFDFSLYSNDENITQRCHVKRLTFEKNIIPHTAYYGLEECTEIWLRSGVTFIDITSGNDPVINWDRDTRIFKNCSPDLVIYVEADSAPSTWCDGWDRFADGSAIPVIYGVTENPF